MSDPTVQVWTRISLTTATAVQAHCIAHRIERAEWLRQLIETAVGAKPAPAKAPKRTRKAVRK